MIRTLKKGHYSFTHDDEAYESEIRRNLTNFFSAKFGKRETFDFYKGFIITRHTVQFTGCKPQRRTVVYAYFRESKSCILVKSNNDTIKQAEKLVDNILQTGNLP